MVSPRPLTIASEVLGAINRWLATASHYSERTDFFFVSTKRSAEMLANADAYAASIALAMLHHTAGDLDEALYWVRNLRKWSADQHSYDTEAIVLSNLGHFSRAVDAIRSSPVEQWLVREEILLLSGAFDLLVSRAEGTSLAETEEGQTALATAARCTMVLNNMGVKESHLQAILEIAGEVLRSHRMFYDDQRPLIRTTDDSLLYQMSIRTEASVAAEMTDEVIVKMVERDLDAPGLAFSFIPV
jgi:hypothetical protein